MSETKKKTAAILEHWMSKLDRQLEGIEDAPAWVKHGMALIHRANVYNPLYQPIVSVQPMSRPVGGIAFYQPNDRRRWEPSAVDRLAALAEPDGELARRIADFDGGRWPVAGG